MRLRAAVSAIICIFSISACQPPVAAEKLATGQVVSLGREHLIVQNGPQLMFLSVDEETKRNLTGLKKGDEITLMGKKDVEEVSPGHTRQTSEVHAIVKADGSQILLR